MIYWTNKSIEDLDKLFAYIEANFDMILAQQTIATLVSDIENLLEKNKFIGSILESNPLFSKINYKGNSVYYTIHPKNFAVYIVYVHIRKTNLDTKRFAKKLKKNDKTLKKKKST